MIGLVLGAARAYRVPVVSQLTAVYVEIIRCTPILVQIFMIYFGLRQLGITFDLFTAAWLSVTLWGGAFNSENFRAGFLAVSQRHREAAYALGFGPLGTFLNVTLPLGGRVALPSSINTYISVHQEHVADVRHRLRGADDDGDPHQQPDAADDGGADGARASSTSRWSGASRGRLRRLERHLALPEDALMPDWSGPVAHYILHEGLPNTLRVAAISLVAQHADRRRARHAADDPVPAVADADPRCTSRSSAACRSS